ncbi:MAG: glycosyltransferase family 2 protein [Solobacterium sp.]|nr:glycosyltransferase family 2 protein [Solobacterium sp.]
MDRILTVSIAAYNREKDLANALDSFISVKTSELVEVLIVDDGSTDRTAEIAQVYESRYPGLFRLVTKENGGWGSTVNRGLKEAEGKYFKVLDADDLFNKDCLDEYLDYLQTTDSDLVCTGYIANHLRTNKQIEHNRAHDGIEYRKTYSVEDVIDRIPMHIHSLTFKTDKLRKNNVFLTEHSFYVDKELNAKGLLSASTVSFIDMNVYIYNKEVEGQSMSVEGLSRHIDEHTNVCLELTELAECAGTPEKKRFLMKYAAQSISRNYNYLLLIDSSEHNKQVLMDFNKAVKQNSYYYSNRGVPRTFGFFEATGFVLYPLMMKYYHSRLTIST